MSAKIGLAGILLILVAFVYATLVKYPSFGAGLLLYLFLFGGLFLITYCLMEPFEVPKGN